MENCVAGRENSIVDLKKLKIELPHEVAILLLGIYLSKFKARSEKCICTPMHSSIVQNRQEMEETQMSCL